MTQKMMTMILLNICMKLFNLQLLICLKGIDKTRCGMERIIILFFRIILALEKKWSLNSISTIIGNVLRKYFSEEKF